MRPLSHYCDNYGVETAHFVEDLAKDLHARGIKKILVLKGVNTDSGLQTKTTADFEGISAFDVDETILHRVLVDLRVVKTPGEIELLRKACRMSAQAHTYVMRHIKPGMTEFQLEALFKAYTGVMGGSRYVAYTCICGAGSNGSVLHYGHAGYPNSKLLVDGDMIVLDMGSEYNGYATDLTRSYPVNGKFTERQRRIHAAVTEAQTEVYAALRPGVEWKDMHRISERVIAKHLLDLGILQNGTVDEICENTYAVSALFSTGLGHLLGLNVHDVGGFHPGHTRETKPGLAYLRLDRKLEPGMVLTVEPGIYFNEAWVEQALKDEKIAKYINADEVRTWYGFGGCRMEDDILITEDGFENLAGEWPTTADEIEAVIACQKE
jgi:Xaa-Pro dipeptidase